MAVVAELWASFNAMYGVEKWRVRAQAEKCGCSRRRKRLRAQEVVTREMKGRAGGESEIELC